MGAELRCRRATAQDTDTLVDFVVAMAKESENVSLDRAVVTRGVEAVLSDVHKGEAS